MTWRANVRAPVDLTIKFLEDVVFGTDLDAALRAGMKNRQSVETIVTTPPLHDIISEIEEGLNESRNNKDSQMQECNDDDELNSGDGGGAPAGDNGDLPAQVSRELALSAKKLATDEEAAEKSDKLKQFVDRCWRKIDMYVVLFQEPSDSTKLKECLIGTQVNNLRNDEQPGNIAERKFVLISYDLKTAGESNSHPSTRLPPLRNNGDHLKTLLRGCLAATDDQIRERDLFLLCDGGRPGLH